MLACTDLAGFQLARALDGRREVTVRLALGASRGSLVRRVLTDTTLPSLLAGRAGIGLAVCLLDLLASADRPLPVPATLDLHLYGRVLAFTLGVSVVTSALLGLVVAALQSTRRDVAGALRTEGAGRGRPGQLRWRNALVLAKLTISLVLLVGAGLFLRGFQQAQSVDRASEASRDRRSDSHGLLRRREDEDAPWLVVGVFADAKVWTAGEAPRNMVYVPYSQRFTPSLTVLARTSTDPERTALALMIAGREADFGRWVLETKTMDRHLALTRLPWQLSAFVPSAFGVLALALAALGLDAVVIYSVACRRREIGSRTALSVDRPRVGLLLVGGLNLVIIGNVVGLTLAVAATRPLAGLLFEVDVRDPLRFLGVPLILGAAALLGRLPASPPRQPSPSRRGARPRRRPAGPNENERAVGYGVPEPGDQAAWSTSGRSDPAAERRPDERSMPSLPGSSRSSSSSGPGSHGTARAAPPALASSATGTVKVTCPPVLSDPLDLPELPPLGIDRRRCRSRTRRGARVAALA